MALILRCDWCRKTADAVRDPEPGVTPYPAGWRTMYVGHRREQDLLLDGLRFEFCTDDCKQKFCDKMVAEAGRDPHDPRSR